MRNGDPQNEDVRRNNGDVKLEKEERWDKLFLEFLEEFASHEKIQGNLKKDHTYKLR